MAVSLGGNFNLEQDQKAIYEHIDRELSAYGIDIRDSNFIVNCRFDHEKFAIHVHVRFGRPGRQAAIDWLFDDTDYAKRKSVDVFVENLIELVLVDSRVEIAEPL